MRIKGALLAPCTALLMTFACGEPQPPTTEREPVTERAPFEERQDQFEERRDQDVRTPMREPGVDPATETQRVTGELQTVDLEQNTFTVVEQGIEHVFTFTDATQVDQLPGPQGLAGHEGAVVTVQYTTEDREDPQAEKTATRIELFE